MGIIARGTLRDFWDKHLDCEEQLKAWYSEASKANWGSPNEIKRMFPSASIVANDRVVFNIKGNHYRLIVKVNYDYGMMYVRFIGTHAEYDKVNAETI